mmetsp:Transcript_115746/g.332502  ORF Transcript_115746/g.332502 Transcript_115746/m.332502 type:complete len:205 (-) Transcript_115746:304-918(-)
MFLPQASFDMLPFISKTLPTACMLSRAATPASSPYRCPTMSAEVSATPPQNSAPASTKALRTSAPLPTADMPTTFASSCHCSVQGGISLATCPAAQDAASARPSKSVPVTVAAAFVADLANTAACLASGGTSTCFRGMTPELRARPPASRNDRAANLAEQRMVSAKMQATASKPSAANEAWLVGRRRTGYPPLDKAFAKASAVL